MKRSHIDALTRALGAPGLVASLHVLSQPSLDDSDHAFLIETSPQLPLLDLLRWLARCSDHGPRARIIAALAQSAIKAPRRFEGEVLADTLPFVTDDDWAELYERVAPTAPSSLSRRILDKTSGCSVYRALLAHPPPCSLSPDPSFFVHDEVDPHALEARVALAFDDASPRLASALFSCRHDEQACLASLSREIERADDRGPLLWTLARAGLLGRLSLAPSLLPRSSRFFCEGGDEAALLCDGALRWLASKQGEAGWAFVTAQIEAAHRRGVDVLEALSELPEAARREVWQRSATVRAELERRRSQGTEEALEALQQVAPWMVSDEALLSRRLLPGRDASPAEVLEAARERIRRGDDARECAALLTFLEQRDTPRKALFELATAALRSGVVGLDLVAWLSQRLSSRSSFEQNGPPVLSALLERRATSALAELFAMAFSEAREGARKLAPTPEPTPARSTSSGFREAAHAAFAQALVQQTRASLTAGDHPWARRLLSALACLDPPSRLNPVLHDLRLTAATDETRDLIEVNESLSRRGGARDATLHGLVSAVHVLDAR